jgi:hypothetical protein
MYDLIEEKMPHVQEQAWKNHTSIAEKIFIVSMEIRDEAPAIQSHASAWCCHHFAQSFTSKPRVFSATSYTT